jgi:hypothetical protein
MMALHIAALSVSANVAATVAYISQVWENICLNSRANINEAIHEDPPDRPKYKDGRIRKHMMVKLILRRIDTTAVCQRHTLLDLDVGMVELRVVPEDSRDQCHSYDPCAALRQHTCR